MKLLVTGKWTVLRYKVILYSCNLRNNRRKFRHNFAPLFRLHNDRYSIHGNYNSTLGGYNSNLGGKLTFSSRDDD